MTSQPLFISRVLWRSLLTPPLPGWGRLWSRGTSSIALLMIAELTALLLMSGLIISLMIVYRATDGIAHDHEKGRFDLLALTPGGGLGAAWARFAGYVHHGLTMPVFRRLWALSVGTVLVLTVLTALTLLAPALANPDPIARELAFQWLLFYLFVAVMLHMDHYYGLVTGALISVIVPSLPNIDARVMAIFAAVGGHFAGYLAAAFTGGLILPSVYESLDVSGWLADVLRVGLTLLMFALVHEALVVLLYRAAQDRLSGEVGAK